MKRKGFTLAEILITLGIVGVVAALTAPALVKNTAGAKVGPTLAKVVNTIEVANEELMLDNNISDLRKVYDEDFENYIEDLSKYIRKAGYNSDRSTTVYNYNATHNPSTVFNTFTGEFLLPDGASVYLSALNNPDGNIQGKSLKGRWLGFYVDINGSQSGNNMMGDDVFDFALDKTGVLVPYGSQIYINTYGNGTTYKSWATATNQQVCNSITVGNGQGCTGSIFENNLKIIYQ